MLVKTEGAQDLTEGRFPFFLPLFFGPTFLMVHGLQPLCRFVTRQHRHFWGALVCCLLVASTSSNGTNRSTSRASVCDCFRQPPEVAPSDTVICFTVFDMAHVAPNTLTLGGTPLPTRNPATTLHWARQSLPPWHSGDENAALWEQSGGCHGPMPHS